MSRPPKINYPSAGANWLQFARQPMVFTPENQEAVRHDTFSTAGVQQSVLERIHDILELDVRFVGREVDQYLIQTEALDNAAWTKSGTPSAPTVTADAAADPDGNLVADQIDFPATIAAQENLIEQDAFARLPELAGRRVLGGILLRANAALSIDLAIDDGVAATSETKNVLTSWKLFFLTHTLASGTTAAKLQIIQRESQPAKTIFAVRARLHYGTMVKPYIKTGEAIPGSLAEWKTFLGEAFKGTSFDYYPDADQAGFTSYKLVSTRWRPAWTYNLPNGDGGSNPHYQFALEARKVVP